MKLKIHVDLKADADIHLSCKDTLNGIREFVKVLLERISITVVGCRPLPMLYAIAALAILLPLYLRLLPGLPRVQTL